MDYTKYLHQDSHQGVQRGRSVNVIWACCGLVRLNFLMVSASFVAATH
jgi:hypothetical protein